jgi:hypothetical protein
VLASRLAGLQPPVDGVSTSIDDPASVEADARQARRLGFGAKLCIHPKQVQTVNRGFSPTTAQREWARRVIEADAASGGAPVAVDGKMVDRPVVLKAQALLAAAERAWPGERGSRPAQRARSQKPAGELDTTGTPKRPSTSRTASSVTSPPHEIRMPSAPGLASKTSVQSATSTGVGTSPTACTSEIDSPCSASGSKSLSSR